MKVCSKWVCLKFPGWILSLFMHFYEGQDGFWTVLSHYLHFFAVFGPCLAHFGPYKCHFGTKIRSFLGSFLGRSGVTWGHSGILFATVLASFCGHFGAVFTTFLRPFSAHCGHFWAIFSVIFAGFLEMFWDLQRKIEQKWCKWGQKYANFRKIHQSYAKLCKNMPLFALV